jgi:hypothetical protein
MRFESKDFAFSSSARRCSLSPRPARLMKNVSIRIPELGPFGDTDLEAKVRAMVAALFVNRPGGGYVETVLTPAIHFFVLFLAMVTRHVPSLQASG